MTISRETSSRELLLERATALLPTLADRATEAEELRQIPPATVDDLREAGLMRIATPARFGGHGTEIDLMFEVAMELGRACGSTAWCYAVWSIHNWMLASGRRRRRSTTSRTDRMPSPRVPSRPRDGWSRPTVASA